MMFTSEYYRALIFYDFKAGLNQDEGVQQLKLAFGDEFPCRATVFKWFKKFGRCHNSLQDEKHTGITCSAVIPNDVSAIQKMLMNDSRSTYQVIQKELNIGFAAIYKIIHDELHMKKVVC
ncbi:histone-lysine N-methyltransferase SETMAR [Trichonephila clavipes]|nr:histone-lysine N-methyltransferase SETMAR [Trichonephila clavipes]